MLATRCVRCGFANEMEHAYCGGCAGELAHAVNGAVAPASVRSDLHMVAADQMSELLRTPASPERASSTPRRFVTQDEIDQLFRKS